MFVLEPDGVGVLDLRYRHGDVFSRRALRGNGLVVVLDAEHLPAAVMQDVTREVRQFETAFLAGVDLLGRLPGCGSSPRTRRWTRRSSGAGAAAVLHALLPAPDAEESWTVAVASGRLGPGPAAQADGWTRPWIRVSRGSARP
jgi:hypothetical protein